MKYLCLIYFDETVLDSMPAEQLESIVGHCMDYEQRLQRSGQYIAAEALQSTQTATTLRLQGDKLSITDGPFAETREQLGGFYLIDAKDLNEAIQIAAKIPPARLGCIEIRPIKELPRL
ncbi:YciI family protein [Pseudomonas sp. USHLN015]|uniref:YciI family protein n=1 Tax=Pseudomonas sp. USHLN015 TaxID=3081296 RepID=UPI00301D21AF